MNRASDEALVRAFRDGDRAAFGNLVERYRNLVAGVAYNRLGDFDRSEDIAQETFVTAWERKLDLREPARIASWLCGIARNLASNQRRRTSRETTLPETATAEPAASTSAPEHGLIAREEADLLWSVLEKIPEDYRETMVLYYRQDNSVADIAAALGVSRDVVRQRLSRGRRMLEKEVAAFVETTLARRKTGDDFVASVLAAIPAGATKAASGSGGISLLLAKLPIAASLLGPVIGLAGGAWGTKQSLDAATSPEERRFLWRCVAMVSLLVAALLTTMAGVWFFFPAMYQSPGFHVLLWCSYCLALLAVITRANRRVVQIKLKCGTAEERAVLEGQADGMLSLAGIRASVVGIVVGCTGWMALLSGILSDWPGLTLVIVAATAILALAWSSLAAATDGKTQRQILFRTTFWTIVLSVVITALRWQAWSVLLP